jgi:hypothetical protein
MQVELSRLELKELIANLGPNCEPEVREKLEAALGQKVATTIAVPGTGQSVQVLREPSSMDDLRDIVRQKAQEAEDEIFRPLTRERDFPKGTISDEELDTINTARRTAWENAKRVAEARKNITVVDAYTEIPPKPSSGRVAIGAVNRVGDKCAKINELGQSVFVCRNGHGYIEEESVTDGCPRCWAGATEGGGVARVQMDDEDSHVESF